MLIDTHCHLDRYPDPISTAKDCESRPVLTVAVTHLPSHYEMAADHLKGMKYVVPALGFHPLAVSGHLHELSLFTEILDGAEFVGEIGLDYSVQGLKSKAEQLAVFRAIAESLSQRPRFATLHSRRAASDVLAILTEFAVTPVVFHWFSDPASVLRRAIAAGHYFSVNTEMLNTKSGDSLIRMVPMEKILTETDGPYIKVNGKAARPHDVSTVLAGLAAAWDVDVERAERQVSDNFSVLQSAVGSSSG